MSDLRTRLIRLANENTEVRTHLLPILREACEMDAPVVGKFEEGKPADPTQNMTEEQKKRWWQEHAKNKDQFAKAALVADPLAWPQVLESYILANPLALGDRWDIVKMGGGEFKVECVESVAFLHGKTYYAGEPDATVSVIGKDSMGRSFKRQIPVGDKLVPTLIRLLTKIQPGSARVAADRALVARLTRIAAANDALRPHLLPMLKEACGCGGAEAPMMGKFEEGKPADPTESMSPEDKKKWELNTLKHKDKFKEASVMTRLRQRVRVKGPPEEIIPGGTLARAEFFRTKPSLALLKVEGREQPVKISTKDLANYLDGFVHPPLRSVLREWAASGTSETPTGATAPADGWADDGSPAWTLVLKGAY